MQTYERPVARPEGLRAALNGRYHRAALNIFLIIVLAHWMEHLVQAFQIWVLGWPVPQARGLLGMPFPVLVQKEWLHYGYALIMLIGFWLLKDGFVGRARTWWLVALWIQVWHHFEHLLLFVQALSGTYLMGRPVPTSIVQLAFPRVELHLFYNAVVFLPMVVAMVLHMRPKPDELAEMDCSCRTAIEARRPELAAATR